MKINHIDRSRVIDQIQRSGFKPETQKKPKILEGISTGSFVEKEKELREIKTSIRDVFIPAQIGIIMISHEPGESIAFYVGKDLMYGTILDLRRSVDADSRSRVAPDTIAVLTEKGVMNISPLQIRTLED